MTSTSGERCLCVFTRAPEAGLSKTRLIPRVGAEAAAALHAAFLTDVCALTRGVAASRVLAVAGRIDHPFLVELGAREGMQVLPQSGGDLGRRMSRAIHDGLKAHTKVCIVGSDSPTLAPAQVERAFRLLDGADVVLGPADDGGYWLVGARTPCEAIFSSVEWGTSSVLAATLALAEAAQLDVALADRHWDVDEPDDLDRLQRALDADPLVAPATRAALTRLATLR